MSAPGSQTDKELLIMFSRIARSVLLWLFWLLLNAYWGIAKDYAFFDNPSIHGTGHLLFYAWFLGSMVLMIWITVRLIWKHKPPKKAVRQP